MHNLNNDLEKARNIITDNSDCSKFDSIYPFTNENLVGSFQNYDFNNKRCLTVLGSSDQALDMHLMGASEITTFDINPLTYYYFYLKKAALMSNISKEDYFNFFYPRGINITFNYDTFSKIVTNLSGDSLKFWSELFSEYNSDKIAKNLLSFDAADCYSLSFMINYLNDNNYDILREKIKDIKIKFINADVTELPNKLTESYDFIHLSNIMQYANQIYDIKTKDLYLQNIMAYKKYKELILELGNHLNENSDMIVCYFFNAIYLKTMLTADILDRIFYEDCFRLNKFHSQIMDHEKNATLVYTKRTTN